MSQVRRDVIAVAGPDARRFLHSLVSQDVAGMDLGDVRWSFLLQPQGKLVSFFRITQLGPSEPDDDSFELEMDAGLGAPTEAALRRYLIRTKAVIRLEADTTRDGYSESERIARGIPAWGHELTDTTIPNETGWATAAVSFTKGCYVGQELVERIDSRGGNVPKRLCRLEIAGVIAAEGKGELTVDGKNVGVLTSATTDEEGVGIGLAYVRREVAIGAKVNVAWSTPTDRDTTAVVRALPDPL